MTDVFTAAAILFDLNGVLADSIQVSYGVYMDFLKQFDVEGNLDEFNAYCNGPTDREIINYIKATYNLEQELTDLDEFYFLLSKKSYDENVTLMKGAKNCLQHFKSLNFQTGLVTSSPIEIVGDFIKKHELKRYFDVVMTGDRVSTGKPSPEIYINALSKLNCSEDSVFVVEDSKNGITSAYKAGVFKIIGIGPKAHHFELMKAGAMVAVESLKELTSLPWTLE